MKYYHPLLILLLSSLFLVSCKKEVQPDMAPLNEACDCATEVSADFEILELELLPQSNPIGTDTDTIFHNSNVIFRAKEENASYTWYIGNEILDTKEVGRNFSSIWDGQDITVSLVVEKEPNSICLPNDDGYDSISRTFHVQPYGKCDPTTNFINDTTFMEGVYRLKEVNGVDSFDMTLDYHDITFSPYAMFSLYNFDGEGTDLIDRSRCTIQEFLKTYRQIWFNITGTSQHCLQGTLHHKLDGTVEFHFSKCIGTTGNWTTVNYECYGRKL